MTNDVEWANDPFINLLMRELTRYGAVVVVAGNASYKWKSLWTGSSRDVFPNVNASPVNHCGAS